MLWMAEPRDQSECMPQLVFEAHYDSMNLARATAEVWLSRQKSKLAFILIFLFNQFFSVVFSFLVISTL